MANVSIKRGGGKKRKVWGVKISVRTLQEANPICMNRQLKYLFKWNLLKSSTTTSVV